MNSIKTTLFLLLGFCQLVNAQEENKTESCEYNIESSAFNTKRKVLVSLPSGYYDDTTQTYPVLYLFDSQFEPYFSVVSSTIEFYHKMGQAVPMIVVGVVSENRSLEFTPKWNHQKTFDGWRGNCGKAEVLTQHLKEEVFPLIEFKYRTKPYRLAVGHSLGGTYVINEIMKPTSVFNGVIAASPNLSYDKEQLIEKGKVFFSEQSKKGAFIYASCGDVGKMENMFNRSLKRMDSLARKNTSDKIIWECNWLNGDNHQSSFLPTVNYGLLQFSKKWSISDEELMVMTSDSLTDIVGQVEKFYQDLSTFAGSTMSPSVYDLNKLAYRLGREYPELAVKILDKAIELFPLDPNINDSKGEMLEKVGKYQEAKLSYKNALRLLDNNPGYYSENKSDYYRKSFTKNIERLSDDYMGYKKLVFEAKKEMQQDNYKRASKSFKEAFKYDIIRSTHIDRKMAVQTFAQTGETNAAFIQLNLLATTFQWRGSSIFENDSLMIPLKSDKRWNEMMKVFELNDSGTKN